MKSYFANLFIFIPPISPQYVGATIRKMFLEELFERKIESFPKYYRNFDIIHRSLL